MKGDVLLALCDTCSDWVSNDLSTRASPGSCRKTSRLTSRLIWVVQRDLMEEFKRKKIAIDINIFKHNTPSRSLFPRKFPVYTYL